PWHARGDLHPSRCRDWSVGGSGAYQRLRIGGNPMVNRRTLLGTAGIGGALVAVAAAFMWRKPAVASTGKFEITKTDEEWRRILTPEQYYVLRDHGTERRGTSPLDHEKRKGTFVCAGCDLPVYSSDTKFDSKTGWPSFWQP